MFEPVVLPAWAFWLLALLAAAAVFHLLLLPLTRWLLRRRVNRVIHELNTRLHLKLQPFKLTRRQSLLDRLLFDTHVLEAAEEHARAHGLRQAAVMAEVRRYAEETVPAFNAYIYFRLGYWLARFAARALYRVRLGQVDEAALARVDPKATVVFVINHRSNMDYLLVSYMVAERTALSYAVGEWARIWPLDTLVRSMGAFFVRRDSKNPLYRRVLERYVAMATAEGVTQAVFPEGGLSRDGRLRPPRLGLIDYMARAFDPHGERDLVFVPVGLNYDRTLEDRTLLLDAAGEGARDAPSRGANDPTSASSRGAANDTPRGDAATAGAAGAPPRRGSAVGTTLRFVAKNLGLMLQQDWHRFGYACVNFGQPLSLAAWCRERALDFRGLAREARFAAVAALGRELMTRIGRVVPVTPVALAATVFVRAGTSALSELEVQGRAYALTLELERAGALIYVPRHDQDYALAVGLRMLTLRHLVEPVDGLFRAVPAELPVLRYYANSIAHLLPPATAAPER